MSAENDVSNNEAKDEAVMHEPKDVITVEILKKALENDLGASAVLNDFKIIDFTKPGDNYMCFVTSVSCDVVISGEARTVSYVAKMNPHIKIKGFQEMIAEVCKRECGFFIEIAPRLNDILENVGEPKLCFPFCVFSSLETGKEILISRDLREQHFRMTDRLKGMDLNHSTLALEELARLHAAGFILKSKLNNKSLAEEFPFAVDSFYDEDHASGESMKLFFNSSFETAIKTLQNKDGYELAIKWLKDNQKNAFPIFKELLKSVLDRFETLCHGDIWNNNILFRYNKDGLAEQVAIVDLQMCRVSSLATDLSYFLTTSLNGDFRKENLHKLLSIYYEKFMKVIQKEGSVDIPFSFDELVEEYKNKKFFGFLVGIGLLPMIVRQSEDTFDAMKMTEENMEECIADEGAKSVDILCNSEIAKLKYLPIFDEMIEYGAFLEN